MATLEVNQQVITKSGIGVIKEINLATGCARIDFERAWMHEWLLLSDLTTIADYVDADGFEQAATDEYLSVVGAACVYRLPQADGRWLQLKGSIVNATALALVVKDEHFGVKNTIDPTWLVSYVWAVKAAAPTAETISA